MKLDALEHPKTLDLADRLGIELPTAIGHLELLWAFVAKLAPTGAIGKFSDAVIADKARWRGKASEFVDALVQVGYLDDDESHRLLVHDWPEHCPNWVRAKLKKAGLNFALKNTLKTSTYDATSAATEDESSDLSAALKTASSEASSAASSRARVLPSLAKPSLEKAGLTETHPSRAEDDSRGTFDGWQFVDQRMRPNYPRGQFTGKRWIDAAKLLERQLDEGLIAPADLDAIEAGCKRYLALVEHNGDEGTKFVVNPMTFLDEFRWRDEMAIPAGKTNGKPTDDPEAAAAWERLLATEGADRPPRVHQALQAIGGWPRVHERRADQTPFMRRDFIAAYVAQRSVA